MRRPTTKRRALARLDALFPELHAAVAVVTTKRGRVPDEAETKAIVKLGEYLGAAGHALWLQGLRHHLHRRRHAHAR